MKLDRAVGNDPSCGNSTTRNNSPIVTHNVTFVPILKFWIQEKLPKKTKIVILDFVHDYSEAAFCKAHRFM